MKRTVTRLVPAALGLVLLVISGPASAQMAAPWVSYPYYPYGYSYGYPYVYSAPLAWWGAPVGAAVAAPSVAAETAAAVPTVTGRSAAEAGKYCTTPAKTCSLRTASWVGSGCSCRVPGGRTRGTVTP